MKNFKRTFAMFCCVLVLAPMFGLFSVPASAAEPSISYNALVTNYGWQTALTNGGMAGTIGRGLQIEQLNIWIYGGPSGRIIANAHVQNIGWTGETSGEGITVGAGQGLRMEAITLKLSGNIANSYSIVYRVHCQNYGWMDWKIDGEIAGTVGESLRIEAIEIRLQHKPNIAYRAHVSKSGWLDYKLNGDTAGTIGQGLQMECLELALGGVSGNIVVTSHVQNIGWMPYQGCYHVVTGTQGQGLRMEAIRLWVQGEVAQHHSIEYRTYVQNIGWQNWVRDGAIAGMVGQSLRIEAIQIRIVKKSSPQQPVNNPTTTTTTTTTQERWQWPVNNPITTQEFGNIPSNPPKGRPYHCGIDIVNAESRNGGTPPIYAAATGTIKYRGSTSGNGNHVIIQHSFNGQVVYSLYSHLSSFDGCPNVGQTVSKGQQIGRMGSTGNSSGTHLHFGVFSGDSNDPHGYTNVNSSTRMSYSSLTHYNPRIVIERNYLP